MLTEYSVGRGTLREALRFLELQGLITIKSGPGGGPAVSTPDSRYLAGTLSIILGFARTPFRAIVDTRSVIEPVVAGAAATRADKEHIDQLRESVERMAANLDDRGIFLDENAHFHDLIAWASGNAVFGYILSSLHWIIDGSVMGVQYPEWSRRVVFKAHRRIYESIAAHDSEKAMELMRAHNSEYLKYLKAEYPELLDQIIHWDSSHV